MSLKNLGLFNPLCQKKLLQLLDYQIRGQKVGSHQAKSTKLQTKSERLIQQNEVEISL